MHLTLAELRLLITELPEDPLIFLSMLPSEERIIVCVSTGSYFFCQVGHISKLNFKGAEKLIPTGQNYSTE
jgi:hypothetical protein